jgi:hypothetical protein
MKIEVNIPDDLIEAIASAVHVKMAATAKAAGKPIKAPKAEEPAPKPVDPPKDDEQPSTDVPPRADVLAKVRELGDKKGREVATDLVKNFAPAFKDVKDEDLAGLLAAVVEALEATEDSAEY